jgi:hypothetical protein
VGVHTGSTRHVGYWMAFCTWPRWLWWWRIWWNEDWQGKPKNSKKTCHSATLSTTNPTWPDPGSNPGRRGGKPATNRLSYGAAQRVRYFLSSPQGPDQFWSPHRLTSKGFRGLLHWGQSGHGVKLTTSTYYRVQEYVELYLHSPPYFFMVWYFV